jgi:P-type Ca2+ transporter type 2C
LLACNSAEIIVMLMAVVIGLPVPFTPVMILWANLIADVPPALALGSTDPPQSDILSRKPRDPKVGIFRWKIAVMLLCFGMSMVNKKK